MIAAEVAIRIFAFSAILGALGCGQHEEAITALSTVSTSVSVSGIYKVYREDGISGVSGEIEDCYEKTYKAEPSVKRQRQFQHCLSMDWAGYQLDSWVSVALKTTNIPFFHEDALNERVRIFLPLSGLTEKNIEDLTFIIDDLLKREIKEANK